MTFRTHRSRFALPLLAATVLPLGLAHAQTIVSPPATPEGTVAAVPGGPKRVGTRVIVASVLDTTGNADNAKKALEITNEALGQTPGYSPFSPSEYAAISKADAKAGAGKTDWAFPFTGSDYQKIGKATKAQSALSMTITPDNGAFTAVAEMYDTKIGALTGYGKASSTLGASGDDALSSAITNAIGELTKTATLSGVVLSKPSMGGLYVARLSLGTLTGARGGARVEYLNDAGEVIAYGTLFDIAAGEGVATIAPETAYQDIFVNQHVRLTNNPVKKRAMPSDQDRSRAEYNNFEKSFGFAAAGAAAVYYIFVE